MAERLVLHVGLMKSGTSFLQQVLKQNREELQRRGVLFPGGPWRNQVRAVRDIIEHGGGNQEPLSDEGPWRTLMAEVDRWPGTAVISMEFLGPRNAAKIRDIVRELPPTRLHVVVTARDLARSVPAMWQESIQNWAHVSWPDYLAQVRAESPDSQWGRAFWSRQGAAAITGTWLDVVGPERLSLVTVPRPSAPRELLWERFASLVPVDPSGVDLAVRSNPSLGLASILVLQQTNQRLRARKRPMTPGEYQRNVKQLLAKKALGPRARSEARLGLDEQWVRERGDLEIARLAALGVPVVGDLEELRCEPVAGVGVGEVSEQEQLEAALDALAEATHQLAISRGAAPR